jgi:hypothetical protein
MRDRDRKREADRQRRARIKTGTWDFPNGGAAEFAKAGAAIHTLSKQLGRSSKSPGSPTKPKVFAPAPARRPVASAPARITASAPLPQIIAPMAVDVVQASPGPPSMVAIGGVPGPGLVDQGYGYPAPPDIAAVSPFTKWRANTESMLAALAAKADMQDRRIALEASQANRRAAALDVARALAGLFSAPRAALPKASMTSSRR